MSPNFGFCVARSCDRLVQGFWPSGGGGKKTDERGDKKEKRERKKGREREEKMGEREELNTRDMS